MKFQFDAFQVATMTADDAAEALELIARQVREGYTSGDAHGAGWWSIEGLSEEDDWTEDDSADLKGKFKAYFKEYGYPNSIGVMRDSALQSMADEHPSEWAEACEEWEADTIRERNAAES